jgi:hypothetical protein
MLELKTHSSAFEHVEEKSKWRIEISTLAHSESKGKKKKTLVPNAWATSVVLRITLKNIEKEKERNQRRQETSAVFSCLHSFVSQALFPELKMQRS